MARIVFQLLEHKAQPTFFLRMIFDAHMLFYQLHDIAGAPPVLSIGSSHALVGEESEAEQVYAACFLTEPPILIM